MPSILALRIKDFEILRGVQVNNLAGIAHTRKPLRLGILINEADFLATSLLVHNRNVFLEERYHDWRYDEKTQRLFYYSRVCTEGTVVVVYEEERERIEVEAHP